MNPPHEAQLDILIFGGGGDLSFRKLIPALYMAHLHERLPAGTRIIGVGRQPWTSEQYVAFLSEKSLPFLVKSSDDVGQWDQFCKLIAYCSADASKPEDYERLHTVLRGEARRIYYLATAPSLFTGISANLSRARLIAPKDRVVLEKPLGVDLASAQKINREVAQYFDEQQVPRILPDRAEASPAIDSTPEEWGLPKPRRPRVHLGA